MAESKIPKLKRGVTLVDLLKTDSELNSIIAAPARFTKILVQPIKEVTNLKENFKTALAVNLIEELPLLGLLFGKKKKGQGTQGTRGTKDDKNYNTLKKTLRELKLISKALRPKKKELKKPTFVENKSDKDTEEESGAGAGTAVRKEKKQGVPLWLAGGLVIAGLMVASKFTNFDGDTEDSQDVLGEDLPDKADEPKPEKEEDTNKDISNLKVVSDELQEGVETLEDETGIDELEDLEEQSDKFDGLLDNAEKEKKRINKQKEKFEKITGEKIVIEDEQPEDVDKPAPSATTGRRKQRKIAAAKAKLTSSQLKWLGDADVTDSNIMARMPAPQAGEQAVGPMPTPGAKPTPGTAGDNPLAENIAMYESGKGGYNAYNRGTSGNATIGAVMGGSKGEVYMDTMTGEPMDFSKMTIEEFYKRSKMPFPNTIFTVGKYQVIPSTMREAVASIGLDPKTTFLDEGTQELIYNKWLVGGKRINVQKYLAGQSENINLAVLDLAMEFASVGVPYDIRAKSMFDGTLPTNNLKRGDSFYAGVGGNVAHNHPDNVAAALNQQRYKNNTPVASSPSSGTNMVNASTDVSAGKQQTRTQTNVLVVKSTVSAS